MAQVPQSATAGPPMQAERGMLEQLLPQLLMMALQQQMQPQQTNPTTPVDPTTTAPAPPAMPPQNPNVMAGAQFGGMGGQLPPPGAGGGIQPPHPGMTQGRGFGMPQPPPPKAPPMPAQAPPPQPPQPGPLDQLQQNAPGAAMTAAGGSPEMAMAQIILPIILNALRGGQPSQPGKVIPYQG